MKSNNKTIILTIALILLFVLLIVIEIPIDNMLRYNMEIPLSKYYSIMNIVHIIIILIFVAICIAFIVIFKKTKKSNKMASILLIALTITTGYYALTITNNDFFHTCLGCRVTECASAVYCTDNPDGETVTCHYMRTDKDGNDIISKDTITCYK
jgi:hypothetical protein